MKDNNTAKHHYVYMLRCSDGSLYTGWTTDLEHRLDMHNSGKGAKYTNSRKPVHLVYYEEYDDKIEAQHRERAIKKLTRAQKEELVRKREKSDAEIIIATEKITSSANSTGKNAKGSENLFLQELKNQNMNAIYLSADAPDEFRKLLSMNHLLPINFSTEGIVAKPVSNHPDMFMCKLGCKDEAPIIKSAYLQGEEHSDLLIRPYSIAQDNPRTKLSIGATDAAEIATRPNPVLGSEYPRDIAYNAACTGKYFIHNIKYTAPELLEAAKELGMIIVDTKQGYAKCSTVIVDEDSIITYDRGLARACEAAGMKSDNILIIEPGHIKLEGYDTGFIGGSSGRVGNIVYFCGDLARHPDFGRIITFIEARNLEVKYCQDFPLTDIGSIISL